MKRNKLNFEEMSTSLEVLDQDSLRDVKGGLSAAELLADIAANGIGNHAGRSYSFEGGQSGYISNVSGDSSDKGFTSGFSAYGGQGGYGNPYQIPEVVVTATRTNTQAHGNLSNSPTYQAFSNMFAAMDISASMTMAGAYYGGSQLPVGFIRGAGVLSALGLVDNGIQFYENPNWNDGAQVALGGTIIIMGYVASAPVSVPISLIGGAGLFAWELAESHQGW